MKSQSQIYSRYFTYIKPITRLPIIRTYGSTIFTLLVTAIFIIFAIRPTVTTILVLQKKITDSEQVLKKVNDKVNNLSLANKNYEKLLSDDIIIKSKIDEAIPNNTNLKSIIATLEGLAKTHEASISALQFQPLVLEEDTKEKLGTLSEISFTFNTEGQYQNLLLLLQDLKRSGRLISIDTLSVSKFSEGVGLIMSLSGKAYYLK